MTDSDFGLSHVALPVTDLDRSIAFYRRFANLEVIHRREAHPGHGVAWISDLTRPFVVVLLEDAGVTSPSRLGGWAHLGVGCLSREDVDERLTAAATAGHSIIGPCDDGPPTGYWGIIIDPDGHNLELSFGQQVSHSVASALA